MIRDFNRDYFKLVRNLKKYVTEKKLFLTGPARTPKKKLFQHKALMKHLQKQQKFILFLKIIKIHMKIVILFFLYVIKSKHMYAICDIVSATKRENKEE